MCLLTASHINFLSLNVDPTHVLSFKSLPNLPSQAYNVTTYLPFTILAYLPYFQLPTASSSQYSARCCSAKKKQTFLSHLHSPASSHSNTQSCHHHIYHHTLCQPANHPNYLIFIKFLRSALPLFPLLCNSRHYLLEKKVFN